MCADTHTESASKPEKKKRKRDREEANTTESKTKEKKKRKKDTNSGESPRPQEEQQQEASNSKKEKKEKRKRMKELAAAASDPAPKNAPPAVSAPAPSDAEAFLQKHSVTIHVPEGTGEVTPVLSFDQLDVPADLRSAFAGFKEPTPIQACSWPPSLEGRDVVGIAETGRQAMCFIISPRRANSSTQREDSSFRPTCARSPCIVAFIRFQEIKGDDSVRACHGSYPRTCHPNP